MYSSRNTIIKNLIDVRHIMVSVKQKFATLKRTEILGPLIALLVIIIFIAIITPRFPTLSNIRNLILQVSIVSLAAIGSTMVIITGGIDLSPGSMIAILTIILATLIKFLHVPIFLAIIIVLILGIVLGLYNGFLSSYFRIPSFITTLASLSIFRGIAFMFNNGAPISSVDPSLEKIFYGSFLGLPLVLYYVAFLYSLSHIIMKYTKFGREIYAIGGNPAASRYSGIKVKNVTTLTFGYAGFVTACAAILMAARLNSGSPNYGVGMELTAIASAVVGGASLSGGKGLIFASLIGALTMVVVQNGLNLHAVPTSIQRVVIGVIIMLAVFQDMWKGEISQFFSKLYSRKSKQL
jgi:ribose transport system permease protein